ncbi:MAG TPA: DUF1330 domain-containing protein [Burkholderiales bacterium]|nr:DUF1330 domain-containing protein [Burkholderiales bacterium]
MAAYIIVEMEVTDPVGILEYRKLAEASVTAYGGRFVVRGGRTEALEGGWEPKRIVVLEFPDAGRARQWWESKEYAEARVIRNRAANTRMILAEGIA